ncbi:MAG: hypothetical protein M1537_03720 [Nitrospirae bacterium]|nr:hypothetical protein [Nitrospirota bacterium]
MSDILPPERKGVNTERLSPVLSLMSLGPKSPEIPEGSDPAHENGFHGQSSLVHGMMEE